MSLLIDGYNLLNVAGILPAGRGPATLRRSRLALLNFLAEAIDPKEVPRTTVVFDASNAPPGLPRTVEYRGLTVRFAAEWPDADSLIEELIRRDDSPRRLLVVSSDHRIQRAARRRRAKSMDSDDWYTHIVRQRRRREASQQNRPARPPVPLLAEDVEYWLGQFGGEEVFEKILREEGHKKSATVKRIAIREKKRSSGEDARKRREAGLGREDDAYNPFPPGYAEDLE